MTTRVLVLDRDDAFTRKLRRAVHSAGFSMDVSSSASKLLEVPPDVDAIFGDLDFVLSALKQNPAIVEPLYGKLFLLASPRLDTEFLVRMSNSLRAPWLFRSASDAEIKAALYLCHTRKASSLRQSADFTNRQWEIFAALAELREEKAVARQLGISTGTTHSHLKAIYRKLGVHSREDAIQAYREFIPRSPSASDKVFPLP